MGESIPRAHAAAQIPAIAKNTRAMVGMKSSFAGERRERVPAISVWRAEGPYSSGLRRN
jgi:hypothetical protein